MIRDLLRLAGAAGRELVLHWTSGSAPAQGEDAQAELEKLQGVWALVSWLYDGRDQGAEGRDIVLSYAGATFTIREGGVLIEKGAFEELDPSRSPKTLVYAPLEIDGRPVQWKAPGIYRLEQDEFVACIGYGGQRPTAFSAEAGSNNELVIYRRVSV
jgi:uncharacterized protein (TIGR03067 family)